MIETIPQGKEVLIHEHKHSKRAKFFDGLWKARAQIHICMPGEPINLMEDLYCYTVVFSSKSGNFKQFIISPEPVYEEDGIPEKIQAWAKQVCELLSSPPDLT